MREHYEVEKELGDRLRQSSPEERQGLYSVLYDELYRRVPQHPNNVQKISAERRTAKVTTQMRFIGLFLKPKTVFLEIGAGSCGLTYEASKHVKKAYALEVSEEIARTLTATPPNFELLLTDGSAIPLPDGAVNVAYSYQVMEHLHPDDALEQLRSIYRVLAPGGVYFCVTPHRLSGPHDISFYFSQTASGLHMKEYTWRELSALFRRVGFSRVQAYAGIKKHPIRLPLSFLVALEALLGALPFPLRRFLSRRNPLRLLASEIRIVGYK